MLGQHEVPTEGAEHEQGGGVGEEVARGGREVDEGRVDRAGLRAGGHAARGVDSVPEDRVPRGLQPDQPRRKRPRAQPDLQHRRLAVRPQLLVRGSEHFDSQPYTVLDVGARGGAEEKQKVVEGLHLGDRPDIVDFGVESGEHAVDPVDHRPSPVLQHHVLVLVDVAKHGSALREVVCNQVVAAEQAGGDGGRDQRIQQLALELEVLLGADQQRSRLGLQHDQCSRSDACRNHKQAGRHYEVDRVQYLPPPWELILAYLLERVSVERIDHMEVRSNHTQVRDHP
mmetsp:Transcript_6723/g.15691  ORF Transcript_6723/g.15691 Transcript_6723/m.15691 type:complete len:284 (-) Transcript_6723:514-1365(-)